MDVGFVKNIQKIKPKKPNPAVDHSPRTMMTVSYTHLTLPTN